ncbi:MAG: hypothetical protein KDA96_20750, partial [Planctomycetaceae bacterium]|nr:hypothetical protein [Planctomycetaceae bacterium]
MRKARRFVTALTIFSTLIGSFPVPLTAADGWRFNTTSVERLANSIDRLEKQLDQYGTIVTKAPDVWGQARLTKYRHEYEQILSAEATTFRPTINATISRSDQAFVTNALALQAAISGRPAVIPGPLATTTSTTQTPVLQPGLQLPAIYQSFHDIELSIPARAIQLPATDAQGNPVYSTTTKSVTSDSSQPLGIPQPADGSLITGPTFGSSSNQAQSIGYQQDKVALEPTIMLDQLSRYMNHLHELRRISEGDDKSDSPGYALHLVRLPVSVLPGEKTREGYGAEVTVLARPHLHDRLLQDTFRGLVINDLVDQWSFPLAKFLDRDDAKDILDKAESPSVPSEDVEALKSLLNTVSCSLLKLTTPAIAADPIATKTALLSAKEAITRLQQKLARLHISDPKINSAIDRWLCAIAGHLSATEQYSVQLSLARRNSRGLLEALEADPGKFNTVFPRLSPEDRSELKTLLQQSVQPNSYTIRQIGSDEATEQLQQLVVAKRNFDKAGVCDDACQQRISDAQELIKDISGLGRAFVELQSVIASPPLSTTPSRRSQQPFPVTLAFDVHCGPGLRDVAQQLLAIKNDPHNKPAILLLDVQKILAEEFNAAYDFLNAHDCLWMHCTPEVATAVRQKDVGTLTRLCSDFRNAIVLSDANHVNPGLSEQQKYTIALAWGIIVEAALLNERLVHDMADLASSKNAYHLRTDWLPYYMPTPPPESIAAFNDYVACRWPIHVVAIDPVSQDQNVADSFSQRRELQLALSLAFTSGRIGAQNFMRMARQLELDMETVSLNRTVVGFSHGDDTFGWRFYPRVQSPDTKGNLQTFAETLFTGGPSRDSILKHSRLEPGIRECTAIVIMPSFVPHVIFDVRTNWFRLTNPAKKELDLGDGVGLSAEITELRKLTRECVQDRNRYRQDEVYRLTRAVDQLESRLPLQTTYVQMPFENSLGGFEFFNTGTPDLAPELKGFYGEPGLSQD